MSSNGPQTIVEETIDRKTGKKQITILKPECDLIKVKLLDKLSSSEISLLIDQKRQQVSDEINRGV